MKDRLGSTAIITYPQSVRAPVFVEGKEVSRYAYDPWGQRLPGISSSDAVHHETGYDTTPVQFTGQRYESYSGLMFYGARYYDPWTKRFLIADNIVPKRLFSAQRFNRYAYVLNNPLRYTDPTGHQDKESMSASVEVGGGSGGNGFWDGVSGFFSGLFGGFEGAVGAIWDALTGNYTPYNAFDTVSVALPYTRTSDVTAFNNAAPNPNPILDVPRQYTSTIGIPSFGNPNISVGSVFSPRIPTSAETRLEEEYHNSAIDQVIKGGVSAGVAAIVVGGGLAAIELGAEVELALESEEALSAGTEVSKLAFPRPPGGGGLAEFGKNVMEWGTGDDAAIARIATLSRAQLEDAGVTAEYAEAVRDFYLNEALRNPGNPSAQGRAELMQWAVDLLRGKP
jgi:RHS repeat-associated protein